MEKMDISLECPDVDAQTLSEKYMEDDIVYHLVGFCKDNLNSIITVAVFSIIFLWIGIYYGIQRASVIKSLKKKYDNIEHLKTKTRNYINFLLSIERFFFKLKVICPLIILGLLGNLFFHYGIDINIIVRRSVTRDIGIGFIVFFIIISLFKWILYKIRMSEEKYFKSIDLSVAGIAEQLEQNLGQNLINMLKQRLVMPRPSKTVEVQVNFENKELIKKEKLMSKELEDIKKYSKAEIADKNLNLWYLENDLRIHKDFMEGIKAFEWCDYCFSLAGEVNEQKPEENIEEKNDKKTEEVKTDEKEKEKDDEKEKGKGKGKGKNKGKEKEKEKEKEREEKEEKKEGEGDEIVEEPRPTKCTNNCIKRYFMEGARLSQEFNFQEQMMTIKMKETKFSKTFSG